MNRLTSVIVFLCFVSQCAWLAHAQSPKKDQEPVGIPEDAVAHVTVRVAQLVKNPALQLAPWEIAAAAGWDNLGIDPTKVERVDVIIGLSDGPPLKFCAVLTFSEDFDIDMDQFKELFNRPEMSDIRETRIGKRKLLFGTYDYVQQSVNAPASDSELAKQIARIGETGVATAVVVTAPMREQLAEAISEAPEDSQSLLRTIATNTQMCALRVEATPKLSIPVVLEASSPQAAQEVSQAWQALLKKIFLDSNLSTKSLGEGDTPVKAAAIAYEKRYAAEITRMLTPMVTDNRLLLRLDAKAYQMFQSGSLLGVITPAILAAERSSR